MRVRVKPTPSGRNIMLQFEHGGDKFIQTVIMSLGDAAELGEMIDRVVVAVAATREDLQMLECEESETDMTNVVNIRRR